MSYGQTGQTPAQTTGRQAWFRTFSAAFGIRLVVAAVAFIAAAWIIRTLTPQQYGQFFMLIAIMDVTAGLIGPAIDTSLVRFSAPLLHTEPKKALAYLAVAFRTKLAVAALLVLAGVVLARPLLALLLPESAGGVPAYSVALMFLGSAFMVLWHYAQAYLQAQQRFMACMKFELICATFRLAVVAAIILAGAPGPILLALAFVVAPLLPGVLAWRNVPREAVFPHPPVRPVTGEFFRFARWVLGASMFTTLSLRIDLFMLGALKQPETVIGHYGAALTLIRLIDLAILTLYNVLLPKASGLRTAPEMRRFLRRFRWPMAGIAIAASPALLLAGPAVRLVLGADFVPSARLFSVLALGALASLGSAPAGTAVYSMGKSHVIMLLEGTKLVLLIAVGLWAIPRYGALGMAWTVALVRGTIGLATYLIAYRLVARMPGAEGATQAEETGEGVT